MYGHGEFMILVKIEAAKAIGYLLALMRFYASYIYCPNLVKFDVRHFKNNAVQNF